MKKKQILSTVLAGLITLNTLGGCANTNSEYDLDDCRISTIDAEATDFGYKVPEGYILVGTKGYKVEYLTTTIETYSAIETEKDGKIYYTAPYGGTLKGNKVYVEKKIYKPVTGDEAKEIIDNYLNENKLKLK